MLGHLNKPQMRIDGFTSFAEMEEFVQLKLLYL